MAKSVDSTSPPAPQTRECVDCHQSKPLNAFFRTHDVCRACVHAHTIATPLEIKVEEHRREKEVKRLMREELKKVARKRLSDRKRVKKEKARRDLIPVAAPGGAPVDPVMKELASRELARRRLIEFVKQFHPKYKDGWVHHDICRRLEKFSRDVEAGLSPRLMILMPPRHGKSQLASKLFPAWDLGHYQHHEIIACSYNVSLALEFSREVRGVLRTDRYATLFPQSKLDPEFQSAEAWKLQSPTGVGSGGYVAAGIGGAINGKGAHILIVDDPIKNAEEAESVDLRQKIWNWYGSTAYTRLAPGGGVLIIQTWWHDDDLAGRLMAEMKADPEADQFEIIKYPAVAEEDEEFRVKGEALHPDRYTLEALMKIKRTIGPRYWSALYQQDPVPEEGAYFTKDMFVYRDESVNLHACYLYQTWDFAISEKKHNDWNVGTTIAVDYDDTAHVVEVVRFKTSDAGKICDEILSAFERYPNVLQLGVEDGQIWRTLQTLLKKRAAEKKLYPSIEVLPPVTDKQVRARPLQGRMQQHKVTFPRVGGWVDILVREFLRFPAGSHDDIVDSVAWGVRLLLGKAPPSKPKIKQAKREKTVAEKLRALAGGPRGAGHMAA